MKRLIAKREARRLRRWHRWMYTHACGIGIHLTYFGRSQCLSFLDGTALIWTEEHGYVRLREVDRSRAYPQVRTRGRFAHWQTSPEYLDDIPF